MKDFESLKDIMFLYDSALKIVLTKIEILSEDYKNLEYNTIEHIKSRLKTPKSIHEKLKRKDLPLTLKSIETNIKDIAGIRIICAFSKDIYEIVEDIKNQTDIRIIEELDYIANPKPSGYRSYHMIVEVPVFTSKKTIYTKVEIQIRTQGMDFWACLEHKAQYKYNKHVPKYLSTRFKLYAKKIAELDESMFTTHNNIRLLSNG